MNQYIAITGPMGAGKTTLMNQIHSRMPTFASLFNNVHHNPLFLHQIYSIQRFAFQLYSIINNFEQIERYRISNYMTDYWFGENKIYFTTMYEQGYIIKDYYDRLVDIFDIYESHIRQPDFIIYLDVNVEHLMSNIATRARKGEMIHDETEAFLTSLKTKFDENLKSDNLMVRVKAYQIPTILEKIPNYQELQFRYNHESPWSMQKLIDMLNSI